MYIISRAPGGKARTGKMPSPPDGFRMASDTMRIGMSAGQLQELMASDKTKGRHSCQRLQRRTGPAEDYMTITSTAGRALEIEGGATSHDSLLPYGRQSIEEDDLQSVIDVLRSELATTGPKVSTNVRRRLSGSRGMPSMPSLQFRTDALHGAALPRVFEARRCKPITVASDLCRYRRTACLITWGRAPPWWFAESSRQRGISIHSVWNESPTRREPFSRSPYSGPSRRSRTDPGTR